MSLPGQPNVLGGAGPISSGSSGAISAGLTSNFVIKTANYTVTTSDYGIEGNSASNITFTMIAASSNSTRTFKFANKNTGIVTIDATALGTIDGVNTVKLRQYDSIEVISDGTIWKTTGSYLPTQATSVISALDIDWSLSNTFTKTLGANSAFTFSNTADSQTIIVGLTNTASNYTVTWPTVAWTAATPPTQTVGAKTDLYTFIKLGSVIYGSVVQNMS